VQAGNMPYALYWEIYSNELINDATPTPITNNTDAKGNWMIKPDGTPGTAWHRYRQQLAVSDPKRATPAAIQKDLHLAYASDFTKTGAALGPAWTTNTSSGAINVGLNNGELAMQVTSNAASNRPDKRH